MENGRLREIPSYIQPYFNEVSQFHHYCEYEKSVGLRRNIEDRFICLRGFSSSTPIFNSAAFGKECLGGGFYFRYKGHGIAVDPGIGFVSFMHRNNIFIHDIDTVIVTHAHLDHNSDVRTLSALRHDYNSNYFREQKFFESFFECVRDVPHNITWYMDEETICSVQSILDKKDVHALSECCDGKMIKLTDDIELCAIRTKHIKEPSDTYGVKLRFRSERTEYYEWGYTSDTRYFDELGQFFRGVLALVFNISDIYPSDVEGRKSKHGHLGFDGSVKILEAAKPKSALASEFCCTNGDYRYEVVKALRSFSHVRIFPSDPGLTMGIDGKFIRCSLCGKNALTETVKTARPKEGFERISYICPDCLF